ncbi:MAG: sigma-54-dependent Fis family transcriptional regulator [Nitrospinae bacterium]|nr:sigma-54-dependent Fis family transcriptional regulator [Nitrospinota bacterium]
MNTEILLIDDDESIRLVVSHQLEEAGYKVVSLPDGMKIKETLEKRKNISIALIDNRLPGKSGSEILAEIKEISPHIVVIFMTAYSTVDLAVDVMKTGAFDFLTKPVSEKSLLMAVKRAGEISKVYKENIFLKKELKEKDNFKKFTTVSEKMKKILNEAKQVATTDAPVLITGETGTGKELLAHSVHNFSGRASKPFIAINCGAIPENLLETELFGYKKGAFTGADKDKKGKIEYAEGGSLFLDEIGELPQTMQVKLLRVLQEKKIERLGGIDSIKIDVRIIAATNRNLAEEIKEGRFRSDLYYRLSVVPVEMPSLVERREDLPILINHFFERYCLQYSRKVKLSKEVIKKLSLYNWPGNIRQLKNTIERMVILCNKDELLPIDIPAELKNQSMLNMEEGSFQLPSDGINLEEVERSFIEQALQLSNGNQTKAAKLLGITRNTLLYRLQKFKLN